MKKLIAIVAIGMLHTFTAHAAGNVGQCVSPQSKVAKNGNLLFKNPVYIYSAPDAASTKTLLNQVGSTFTIKAEKKGYVQLASTTNGQLAGWGKVSDFEFQDLRNCEF